MAKRKKQHHERASPEAERLRAEEDDLFRRFRAAGSEETAKELFEEIERRLRDFVDIICRERLKNAADVEDATQETFAALWKRRKTTRAPSLSAFLATAAHHAASEIRRKRRHEPTADEDLDEVPAVDVPDPLEADDAERLNQRIWQVVAQMSLKDQEVIRARYGQGITSAALARDCRLKGGTTRQRLARAMKRLRELLREAMPELFSRTRRNREKDGHIAFRELEMYHCEPEM